MTIQVGEKLPAVDLQYKTGNVVETINTGELFAGKKVVLFALPGAYTPTCSASHLPGYVVASDELFAKGVDRVEQMFVSLDRGDSWELAAPYLPPISSVRFERR